MDYVNRESAKEMARIRLFEKKSCHYLKKLQFSKLSFKIGFIGIVKYCYFPVFLTYNQSYGQFEL